MGVEGFVPIILKLYLSAKPRQTHERTRVEVEGFEPSSEKV